VSNADLQQALWWLASNMHIWVPATVTVLATTVIAALHFVAAAVLRGGSE
jgi:hypothetical protein